MAEAGGTVIIPGISEVSSEQARPVCIPVFCGNFKSRFCFFTLFILDWGPRPRVLRESYGIKPRLVVCMATL